MSLLICLVTTLATYDRRKCASLAFSPGLIFASDPASAEQASLTIGTSDADFPNYWSGTDAGASGVVLPTFELRYVVALVSGVYTPELFPTEIRLRANGICNTLGRGATVVSPFVVGALMASYQLPGVVWLMIGLVVVQILVVWAWGVEPRNRGLEELATAKT